MKIGTFYGTTLRIHPAFPLLLLLYCLAGQSAMIAAYAATLLLHELGHVYAAYRMKLPISEIELTPLGGAMQIDLSVGLTGRGGCLLAGAGIAVNLICLLAGSLFFSRAPSVFLVWFLFNNLFMILVNLLPILPLDGGRILFSLLSVRFDRQKVFRTLLTLGRVLAVILLFYCLYAAVRGSFKPKYAIFACFLLYSAALEEKHSTARYLAALFSRRYRLANDTALPVQHLCVMGEMPLFSLLPQLQPNAYHLIEVLDETGNAIIGTLYEKQLYEAILHNPTMTIGHLINIGQ